MGFLWNFHVFLLPWFLLSDFTLPYRQKKMWKSLYLSFVFVCWLFICYIRWLLCYFVYGALICKEIFCHNKVIFNVIILLDFFHYMFNEMVGLVWLMVFNTTFNNISVISWQSVLLVEEFGVPGETHRPVISHWQTLSHNVVSNAPPHERISNSHR